MQHRYPETTSLVRRSNRQKKFAFFPNILFTHLLVLNELHRSTHPRIASFFFFNEQANPRFFPFTDACTPVGFGLTLKRNNNIFQFAILSCRSGNAPLISISHRPLTHSLKLSQALSISLNLSFLSFPYLSSFASVHILYYLTQSLFPHRPIHTIPHVRLSIDGSYIHEPKQ